MPLLSWTSFPKLPSAPDQVGKEFDRGQQSYRERTNRSSHFRPGIFESCANSNCRSGWLHLWRNRSVPVFEDGWTCSPECTEARLLFAIRRELEGATDAHEVHRHRIPLGLLMLKQGWITRSQLRKAVEAQKAAGMGRLGQWLVEQRAVEESMVTRALGLQWSCPVLAPQSHRTAEPTAVMPRLFIDAFGALPLRLVNGRLLYLGFEERPDPVLALAVDRMLKLRVECGIVPGSHFRSEQIRMLEAKFPSLELVEAVSEAATAHALSRSVEKARPIASRLVRVHGCLWLRMWLSHQSAPLPEGNSVRDVLCSIRPF
jgi:hypothetical protein